MYWEADKECMDREELEQLQLERLQSTLNRVYRNVAFYRAAFDAHRVNLESIRDLAALIGRIMDCRLKIITEDQRVRPAQSEVERLLASNALAASLLKWEPAVGLEEGLRKTVEFYRKHKREYWG